MTSNTGAGSGSGSGQSGAGTAGEIAIHKSQGCYTYSRSVFQVHQEYDQLDPARIGRASVGWKAAGEQLAQLAEELKTQIAQPLDAAWSSPQASALAQARLQRAEATARALSVDCLQMAKATDLAATYAQTSKQTLPSYTDALLTGAKDLMSGKAPISGGQILSTLIAGGPAAGTVVAGGMAAADVASGAAKEAVQHMTALLDNYSGVLDMLPASVQSGIAAPGGGQHGFTKDPKIGVGQGAGGVGSAGGIGTASAGAGAVPSFAEGSGSGAGTAGGFGAGGSGAAGSGRADPYAAGSSLAGSGLGGGLSSFDPSELGAGAGSAGTSGGLGAGALAGLGLGAGGLSAGAGAGLGRAGMGGAGSGGAGAGLFPGEGVGGVGGVGGAGSALSAEQAAASGAGRGTGMMPMQGAGAGESEEERERSTWLEEDQDIWGIGDDRIAPPVIEE